MKTSKTLFCLMLFTLVVLNEGRPARNNSRHGQQVHVSCFHLFVNLFYDYNSDINFLSLTYFLH